MNSYLVPGLQSSPTIFRALFREVSDERLDQPTAPGRFTPREVIAHLADWEPILRDERMRDVLEQPGRTVAAYDEGEIAERNRYRESDPEASLQTFAAERAKTVAFVQGLTEAQMDTPMIHPERGTMTIRDLANTMLGHDLYHIEQLLTTK